MGKTSSEAGGAGLMREKLSSAIHVQWAHWTDYMLNNMTPENVARWKRQVETPYEELTEVEKDKDREWADRFMDIMGAK